MYIFSLSLSLIRQLRCIRPYLDSREACTAVIYRTENRQKIRPVLIAASLANAATAAANIVVHYIRQVNGVKLAEIMFYLRFRPSVRLCAVYKYTVASSLRGVGKSICLI